MEPQRSDIEIYDRAVHAYLSAISDKVIYSITSQAFQNMGKNMKYADYIPYSMISYYREPNFEIDMSRYNYTQAVFGDRTQHRQFSDGSRQAQYVHSIPVNLTYQVDIWATKNVNVQLTSTKLISRLYMEKQILVAPMNPEGEPARFHILDIEWVDNSDLEAENERGKIYRHTVKFTVAAYIKLVKDLPTVPFGCPIIDIYHDNEEGDKV